MTGGNEEMLYGDIRSWCFECPLSDCNWGGDIDRCPYAQSKIQENCQEAATRPDNPYRPGTRLWRLYQEDLSELSIVEIAAELSSTVYSVRRLIYEIYRDTGLRTPYRHMKKGGGRTKAEKPLVQLLREGDFSSLTVPEIAEALNVTESAVRSAMRRVYVKTGSRVPFAHRASGRRTEKGPPPKAEGRPKKEESMPS